MNASEYKADLAVFANGHAPALASALACSSALLTLTLSPFKTVRQDGCNSRYSVISLLFAIASLNPSVAREKPR